MAYISLFFIPFVLLPFRLLTPLISSNFFISFPFDFPTLLECLPFDLVTFLDALPFVCRPFVLIILDLFKCTYERPLAFNYNLIFWPDLTTVTLWYAWNKTSHDIQPEKETFWMDSFSISVSFWLTSQCVAALVSQYYSSPSAPGVQYVDAPKTVQAEWSSASAESVCCQSYAVAVTAAAESGVDEWMVFQTMCLFGKCPHREMHSGIEIGWLVRGLWRGWLRNELLGEEFKKMKINF